MTVRVIRLLYSFSNAIFRRMFLTDDKISTDSATHGSCATDELLC